MKARIMFGGILAAGAAMAAPQWISGDTDSPDKAAPILEKSFELKSKPSSASLSVAFAGWGEVMVNGEKVGSDVLSPVTCQPDKRLSSVSFDVAGRLRPGRNTIGILLGNGWFNAFTKTSWGFSEAPWVSGPKARGSLVVDGAVVLETDGSWRAFDSPVVFNSLRNGERYDARLEGGRRNERPAKVEKYSPWGAVSPEDAAPCREFDVFEPQRTLTAPDGCTVYDFGANISGWCEIEVEGESGAVVSIDYDESIKEDNSLLGYVAVYIKERGDTRPVQHDEYVLAGRSGGERWHPRFTYHGFRYAKVSVSGRAAVKSIRARFVHSAFPEAGSLQVSDETFAALQSSTLRSYLSNFVGIPTDCPHREKNGWTGDTQLAMETGLWNFDARAGYVHFLRMMLDAQLPNGAVPCILPCSPKFGYFWGSGPAWDAVLFEVPWQIYRFYGDDLAAREAYPAMKRYLAFLDGKADADGLVEYGLGDWCPPGDVKVAPLRLTDSAYAYSFNRQAAFWAARFGDGEAAAAFGARAEAIAKAFNKAFYRGDGVYGDGGQTSLAAPLYFDGLCERGEKEKTVRRLVEAVRARKHLAGFGILGAKWVPRVLAANGHADDAWKLVTQKEMPGWAHWLQFGDGTLREKWDDSCSHNHIMFGDISAWAYEYVAGIVPLEPGFRKVAFRPNFVKGVESFSARHMTPHGEIKASWKIVDGKPVFEYSVPPGVEVAGK